MTDESTPEEEQPDGLELTRRDALAALASAGVAVGAAGAVASTVSTPEATDPVPTDGSGQGPFTGAEMDAIHAVAHTVYPSAVSGVEAFVETYTVGRASDRPAYAEGMAEAVAVLDERARTWFGDDFAALGPADRDATLRQLGVDGADPDPDGIAPQRVRFYLVNELLYALFTSPKGGDLVGIENPQGYPGGSRSYTVGPDDAE